MLSVTKSRGGEAENLLWRLWDGHCLWHCTRTLGGRQLHEFRLWRREDGDSNTVSEKTQMDTLRLFSRWLESIDCVIGTESDGALIVTYARCKFSRRDAG